MRAIIFLFILLIIATVSCQSDDPIPADLQVFLDRFEEEANKRNLSFADQVADTEIHLVEIISGGVLGQCVREEDDPNQIHLDRTYWEDENTTDLQKEFVVFHELGHCILNRDHINTADNNGVCVSVMYNGNSSMCNLSYTEDNREELLDELFK